MRSLRGKAPADGRPLRCGAHRNGRRHRLSQTLYDQPARLDRVPQARPERRIRHPLSASRAPWSGLECRGCRACGLRGSSDLSVPILAGSADGKPPVIRCPIPPPMRLGMGCPITGKPAPQPPSGQLRTGRLFPSGPSVVGRGPTGKRRLTGRPMSGHWPGSAAACAMIVRFIEERRAHGQLPPLREDDQT